MSGQVRPTVVLDCPTAEEVMEEWNALAPKSPSCAPLLPPLDAENMVVLRKLARELNRDGRRLTERAKKLGCWVEYRYVVSGNGRQRTAVTNALGADAIRRWYGQPSNPPSDIWGGPVDNLEDAEAAGWVYRYGVAQ